MSWYSDREPFDEYDPPFCRDCTKDTDKAACDRCFAGHFEGEEDDDEKEAIEEANIDGLYFSSSEMQDGFYAVKDGVLYQVSLPAKAFENAKTVTLPPIKVAGKDDE